MKSIFSSLTFWGIIFMLVEVVSSELIECLPNGCAPADYVEIVKICAGALVALVGRYNAKEDLFTPRGLPGRDKPKDKRTKR